LITSLQKSFDRIARAIQALEVLLDQTAEGKSEFGLSCTCRQRVGGFIWHKAYHAGQVGLLRGLLGKTAYFEPLPRFCSSDIR